MTGRPGRCPVCRARFRGTRECSRCGADLKPLMVLACLAGRSRRQAWQALSAGRPQQALEHAETAQRQCASAAGASLCRLLAWLGAPEA